MPLPPPPPKPVPPTESNNKPHHRTVSPLVGDIEKIDESWKPAARRKKISVKSDVPLGNKPGQIVGRSELSRILGVSITTVGDWHNMGMPAMPKDKGKGYLYDTAQVLKWRVQHEHNLVKASMIDAQPLIENQMSAIEADRREKAAKAQLAELKLAKERSLVANIDDIMLNVGEALVGVRAGLMSLKSSLPGRLAHKDEYFIAKAIDKEVTNLLEKLSDYDHEYQGAVDD